eukprot:gene2364-1724_t
MQPSNPKFHIHCPHKFPYLNHYRSNSEINHSQGCTCYFVPDGFELGTDVGSPDGFELGTDV